MSLLQQDVPLQGVRILDASNLIAAPLASTVLGDFGAEVIKVEHPVGDSLRHHGHSKDGIPLWWTVMGRNKKCITLNLSTSKGARLFRQLAAEVDVVLEAFRPGTMERWGLGYDELKEANPSVIMARVSGYGQTGPYSKEPGFGTIGEAMSGFAFRNGHPDGPPTLPPLGLGDGVTGIATALAIMMALFAREQTGRGQVVDVSIVEPLLMILSPQIIYYDQLGEIIGRTGNRSMMNAPRNAYRSKDGDWIAISASTLPTATRLMDLIGRNDFLEHEWFLEASGRMAHADEIDDAVQAWLLHKTTEDALAAFRQVGAPATKIYNAKDVVEDEHYRVRESVTSVEHPLLGQVKMPNVLFRLSETPGRILSAGPQLGEHNGEVYSTLGLSEADLADLENEGVI